MAFADEPDGWGDGVLILFSLYLRRVLILASLDAKGTRLWTGTWGAKGLHWPEAAPNSTGLGKEHVALPWCPAFFCAGAKIFPRYAECRLSGKSRLRGDETVEHPGGGPVLSLVAYQPGSNGPRGCEFGSQDKIRTKHDRARAPAWSLDSRHGRG